MSERLHQLPKGAFWLVEHGRPREECGVFAVYLPGVSRNQLEHITFNGLLQNQHRGEESAGFCLADGRCVSVPFTNMGLVRDAYRKYTNLLYRPDGFIGLSHTRYSTTGSSCIENAAPIKVNNELGEVAVAHNGNLTNAKELKKQLGQSGVEFTSTTDSEVLAFLIAKSDGKTWEEKMQNALEKCEGSFSLAMITKDALFAVRDKMGNRPLFWASFNSNGATGYAVSSETPAFNQFNRFSMAEVKPGEIIRIDQNGHQSFEIKGKRKAEAFCGLEITYLLRADGRVRRGVQVDAVRRRLGQTLAQYYPPPDNIGFVTYIPESAKSTAEGFAQGLRDGNREVVFRTAMLKGRYGSLGGATRGFINPHREVRSEVAGGNYYPFDWLSGKRIVLVDDSIIRGNTTEKVARIVSEEVGLLKNGGAREVHLRIPWPPVFGFCPLGTDINKKDNLIWRQQDMDLASVRSHLGVDSLAFLTPEQFQKVVDQVVGEHLGLCMGCTTGEYPVEIFEADKFQLE